MTKVTTQNTTSGPIILTASSNGIARAAKALRDGKVVGFGTETVYGLGALASDQSAVASVFQLKRRPSQNPLICHVDGRDMAETIARVDRRASMVMAEFWPGPLTLILPQKPAAPLAEASTAGLATVAVRAPAHDTARRLITAVDAPIVAPSANKSGGLSPTSAAMVADAFRGEIELILSGGNCTIGLESTVLDLSQETPAILRMGAITPEHLDHLIPGIEVLTEIDDQAPRAPGQMLRHYAPAVPVRINVRDGLTDDEAFLSFGPNPFAAKGGGQRLNLSKVGDLEEAARNLFAMLRELEASGPTAIAVAPIPDHGIGAAINDRLRRAAAATATATATARGRDD